METKREVQSHGKIFENEILKIYVEDEKSEEIKKIKYTEKYDLPSHLNSINNANLSVKSTQNINNVCMGDALRLFDSSEKEKIHIIVVKYEQNDLKNTKKVNSIIEFDMSDSRNILFGSLTREQIQELDKVVKEVPRNRKPNNEEKIRISSIKKNVSTISGILKFCVKCNSQQSRLQCSLNFKKLIENNSERIIEYNNTNILHGKQIIEEIVSGRRKFNKKKEIL